MNTNFESLIEAESNAPDLEEVSDTDEEFIHENTTKPRKEVFMIQSEAQRSLAEIQNYPFEKEVDQMTARDDLPSEETMQSGEETDPYQPPTRFEPIPSEE